MYQSIIAHELEQLVRKENVKVIDVRETYELSMGHIKNMIHMPISEFGKHLHKINKNDHYYVVCLSGSRSQMVSNFLAQQGYKITNVLGGMSAYNGDLVYEV
ncbi:rhodanese-like domain-containing protein [Acholeplasma granularum]|uniref:rhodanese-like domain-containing protein n=1 Tax=Acholeplasma granularum TaxID=264635 RepID=UPI0004B98BE4|nr:rhodanese-like domain-containing protein [Acholeplasma granularum]